METVQSKEQRKREAEKKKGEESKEALARELQEVKRLLEAERKWRVHYEGSFLEQRGECTALKRRTERAEDDLGVARAEIRTLCSELAAARRGRPAPRRRERSLFRDGE